MTTEANASPAATGGAGSSPRGQARREQLLALVVHDISLHGLVDFSLRRAARAAGTSHKVLLYHFGSYDELLREALTVLRTARIRATDRAAREVQGGTLADRVEQVWRALASEPHPRVLDQASALSVYDPQRYTRLAADATGQYLPGLMRLCPEHWSRDRRLEVSVVVLASLRGLLSDLLSSGDAERVDAGLRGLRRMLDLEESRQQ